MELEQILSHDATFRYMLLDRMKMDCAYFLGYGGRYAKHLWAGDVVRHISYMRAIHNSFPDDGKPEWLTLEDIDRLEFEMLNDGFSGRFYTPYKKYSEHNGKRFTLIGKTLVRFSFIPEGVERYEIRLEDGSVIPACADEINGAFEAILLPV